MSRTQVAVVTGAASGIGRALASRLAADGWLLALCDIDEAGLQETVAGPGGPILAQRVDVADRSAVFAFARRVLDELGHADLVINNAGVALSQTIVEMNFEDFEWVMEINFWGVVNGCKAFLPHLLARGSGRLVNICSTFGLVGAPAQGAYNAAKFAVRGFSECLRQELAGTGVGVSCVHPGGIKTNIVRNGRFYRGHDGELDRARYVRTFDRMARTSPERAANAILRGIHKGKKRILVGLDAHLIDHLARLFPAGYERWLERLLRLAAK